MYRDEEGGSQMAKGAATRMRKSREKILAAAETLFLTGGFAGTNMDAVAEAAGMSKQTVYAHFGSKEALFVEVITAMTGGANTALEPVFMKGLADRPPEDFLTDFAISQLRIVLTPRLMQLRRLVIGEVERFPELGRALHENGPARSIAWLARVFAAYGEKGELAADDPEAAAGFFNWIVMGGPTNDAMFLGDAALPDAEWIERHARESVRIFLAAFGVEGR